MAISTNQKPTIYRNFFKNTGPVLHSERFRKLIQKFNPLHSIR